MHPDQIDTAAAQAGASHGKPNLALSLDSSAHSVRAALAGLRSDLAGMALGCEVAATVELVLAEVMNNVCEHAYLGAPDRRIEIDIWDCGRILVFEIRDDGVPMPGGRVPAAAPLCVDRPLDDLPEGGYGWHLIRHLTADLTYARIGSRNHLRFGICRDLHPTG